MLISVILGLAATAAELPRSADGQVAMSRAEIRAYNAKLARSDPAYIRCQRSLDTGSLVKKTTRCRTNEEWRRVEQTANDDVRYTMDRNVTSQSTAGS